jgi:tryptophan-rich sensory protein
MVATPPKHPWLGLLSLLAVCFAAAAAGGAVTTPKIDNWYAALAKPTWTPPNQIFAPVWSMLYLSMAIAAWLVWRQNSLAGAVIPMTLFGLQLLLNALWTWLFFGLESPGAAFVDILLLWAAIAVTTVAFWRRSTVAGILCVPYLGWVSFAAMLNFAIWRLHS